MGSLYFSATFYCMAGVILWSRYNSKIASDLFWSATWWISMCMAVAVAAFVAPDASILFTVGGVLLFSIAIQRCIPSVTSFGAGYLKCKFSLPLSLTMALETAIQGFDLAPFPASLYYTFQLIFLSLATFYTLCTVLSELPKHSIHYPRLKSSLNTLEAHLDKITPKVSVHVPCYAEPPNLVITTLNAIAQFEYENFEVLIIDNNTQDPTLWQPVEAHCAGLGARFRFFHVNPLSGAKSGALNFALRHTAADTEIIVVIDADYVVAPDFLTRFAPLFKDNLTAFVQTSHDYYDWEQTRFLRAAYYHYQPPHKLRHPALNEYDAAYLVGTVCMIRRRVIEELGGWAEWALTEDLELSMRILAAGYRGHVFSETWGLGLIPETMDGIKKQQFRWWAGATQEFKAHWRHYFTIGPDKGLTLAQRGLRFYAILKDGLITSYFLIEISIIVICFHLLQHDRTIYLPISMLFLFFAIKIERIIKILIETKAANGQLVSDYVLALLMKGALRWTGILAFALPMLGTKLAWVRTNKFKKQNKLFASMYSSRTETLIGLIYLTCAATLFYFANFRHFDLFALCAIQLSVSGFSFLSTLVMAIISSEPSTQPSKGASEQ